MVNSLVEAWRNGHLTKGIWSTFADQYTTGILARAGADYVCIDLQHGFATETQLPEMLATLRQTPTLNKVVRVPWNRPDAIMRALDLGADTVIVPMVNSEREAIEVVAAAKYPELGSRSWGPLWVDVAGIAPHPSEANADTACVVMIETKDGLDNLEDIVKIPGIDGVYIGPNDLALSCGFGRATYRDSKDVEKLLQNIVDAVVPSGKTVGLHCSDRAMASEWGTRGVKMLTVGTDSSLFLDACVNAAG